MKKLNLLLLAAVSLAFVACDNDKNEADPNANVKDLIGTWYEGVNPEVVGLGSEASTMEFTADGKFQETTSWRKIEGTYSLDNGTLIMTPSNSWDNDNGKWVETDTAKFSTLPEIWGKPKFLNNAAEMLFRFSEPRMHQEKEGAIIYFKKGASEPSDMKALAGTWIYWMGDVKEQTVRVAVKFEGNKYDLFIPVWRQRESGTFEFKKGMVVPTATKWYERSIEAEDSTFNAYDPKNLELCWTEHDGPFYQDENSITGPFGFIVDNAEAYGQVVGLPAVFMKQ